MLTAVVREVTELRLRPDRGAWSDVGIPNSLVVIRDGSVASLPVAETPTPSATDVGPSDSAIDGLARCLLQTQSSAPRGASSSGSRSRSEARWQS
jgi:hypothetical protein